MLLLEKSRFWSSVDLWTLKCLTSYMWDMHQSVDHNKQLVFKIIMCPQTPNLKLNICCLMNWCTKQKARNRGTKIFLQQNQSASSLAENAWTCFIFFNPRKHSYSNSERIISIHSGCWCIDHLILLDIRKESSGSLTRSAY